MRLKLMLIVAAAIGGSATPTAARDANCSFLNAVYAPANEGRDGRHRLTHVSSPLGEDMAKRETNSANYVLRLADESRKLTHYFGFAFPNGHAWTKLLYLGAQLPPQGLRAKSSDQVSAIMYFDAKMHVAQTDPDGASAAPQFLIMPGIAGWFWYSKIDDGEFTPSEGLWKRVECAAGPRYRSHSARGRQ
jgi:hypothetical protein